MKRKTNDSWIFMCALFLVVMGLTGPLFSQYSASLLYNFQEKELISSLELDSDQVESLKRLGNMLQSQATQDRQNFKDNVQGLIAAAERRLVMAENLLNTFLNDTQKKALPEIKEEQKPFRQFFILNEVLVLDPTQSAKILTIIESFKPQPLQEEELQEDFARERMAEQREIDDRDIPGQRNGRMERPANTRRDKGDIFVEIMREKEKKKLKAIEAILTPEQKIPYTQLKEILRKEFDLRMEKEKEKHKD